MDLAELKFVVDTKQLETAATRVAELGTAVSKLNKPMQDLNKESAKNNKELSKAEEAAAKAALAQLKLEQAQTKSADSTGKSTSVLERQTMILGYMATGLSKGQASYMATAKAAGALDEELEQLETTLKTQRSLIGGDAFDKSIGLMQKLSNETKVTAEVNKLFNQSLGLTEKQMIELAREKERLIALYNHEKRSLDGLDAEYQQIINKSVELNGLNDARTNSMRQQVKAQNDAAKANSYIANEMERVNRLTDSNGDLTSATNNKLIKFEQSLRASGRTAAEVSTQLEVYKQKLLATQKAAGNRQVDYLSRALGPQITDIAVGLATGQAPLTILLQQGGQLRDQFALAGVAGSEMGKMLVQASKAMVSSVKDIGLAVGQLVAGAVTGTGKAVVNLGMQLTGTSKLIDLARNKMVEFAGANSALVTAFDVMGRSLTVIVGLGIATLITGFIALGVAMVDVIKEENALNRALNLTGAALGLNLDMAYDAARGMEEFGVSTGTALTVLTEMAKIGGMSSDSLQMVATTAKAMKTAFDIPIADTVKQFKELQEKPTESLTKLAIKLGTIPVEVLKQVDAYERAGNSIKAAEIATKAYADAGKDAADRTVENFGTITRLGISLGKIWNSTWESIMGIGRIDTNDEKITKLSERLAKLLAAQDPRQIASRKPLVDSTIAEIQAVALQIAQEKELVDQRAKTSAEASKFEDDKKKRDEEANKRKAEAARLEESYKQMIQQATNFQLAQVGAVENLTKAEVALSQVRSSDDFKAMNPKRQAAIVKIYEEAKANEILKRTEDERKRDVALIADLYGKNDKMGDQYYSTLRKLDDAFLAGNVSLEEYGRLLNIVYKTSASFKSLEGVKSSVGKNIETINADRQAIASQYGMDFKTEDEKASLNSLSKFKTDTLKSDAQLEKNLSDAKKVMNEADYKAAEQLYKQENELQKEFLKERYDREQYQLTDAYKRNEAYRNSFEDLFKGMGDAIVDFALTGKTSFSDMVNSMIVGLIKLEMQMAMTNMYKSMGGSQGIISTIVSSFAGTPTPSAKGNVFNGGLQAFAKGGSFTNGIVNSPTMFNMGLMGEAGPEAIMPLRRGSDGSLGVAATGSSGGNVSVQVINNSNAQATTNETTDSKGNRKIEVIIGEMTAGEISRSGSSSQKSIKSTFGIQPQLIRR